MLAGYLIVFAASAVALHASPLEPSLIEMANATILPAMTLEEKTIADADSAAADSAVAKLEKARDEAWHHARGNLAVASSPPIRSSAVFAMLSSETDKFAQLENSITTAKNVAAHKRRIAELAGSAWDALESKRLKKLRLQAAEAGLIAARAADAKAVSDEAELLREYALEKSRVL